MCRGKMEQDNEGKYVEIFYSEFYKGVDVLDKLVQQYNNTKHASIKMTPVEASKTKNENSVWRNLYGSVERGDLLASHAQPNISVPVYAVGDRVRITKKKKTFEKGYTSRWSEEVFTVAQVKHTTPITYKITYYSGEEILGSFYEQELQKTNQEVYRIEKIIKKGKTKIIGKMERFSRDF